MAKVIMIQGTMSDAGKSLICAGLCRIFKEDGYRVAPFKSQNMALNSYITEEGLEMGRAQVVQAQAAGVKPCAAMNPILLKPSSDTGSQVIVLGKPVKHMPAKEYFAYKKQLLPVVEEAFLTLSKEYDIVVIEGAGSPAEINLKQDDIVNMGMARLAKSPVLLVGDIDRGGVFAQLYGTIALLTEEEQSMVKGLIINKFRGDQSILKPGLAMLEELCQIPVVGVVPYSNVDIEAEDSLSIRDRGDSSHSLVDIAVIHFPRLSNFTDFQVFTAMEGVSLRYVDEPNKIGTPDLVILPGTKNTIEDLLWMRQNGLEASVLKLANQGCGVIGICGGYQMLGKTLMDEEGTESGKSQCLPGLSLLPIETAFYPEKKRTRVSGKIEPVEGLFAPLSGYALEGYEIHMGISTNEREGSCFSRVLEYQAGKDKERREGAVSDNVLGTYIHGIFDGPGIAAALIRLLAEKKGVSWQENMEIDYDSYREEQFQTLADVMRKHLDMDAVYKILNQGLEEA